MQTMRATALAWLFVGSAVILAAEQPPSANPIDKWIFAKMQRDKVPPAPISSDAEFLRRLHLDVTGLLPDVATTAKFLADQSPGCSPARSPTSIPSRR